MCCPCCDNTLTLGCFDPCGLIFDTGTIAGIGEDGTYTLILGFGRRDFRIEQDVAVGEPIKFSIPEVNENYTYIAQIKKPDGDVWMFGEYDCFKFTTKLGGEPEIIL